MIGKSESNLEDLWNKTKATQQSQKTWDIMFHSLPSLGRLHLWSDADRFEEVITRGCWPLHPLATWFLTRQKEIVQSRSALTFIKEAIASVQDESAVVARVCGVGIVCRQQSVESMFRGREDVGRYVEAKPSQSRCTDRDEKRRHRFQPFRKIGQTLQDNVFAGFDHT